MPILIWSFEYLQSHVKTFPTESVYAGLKGHDVIHVKMQNASDVGQIQFQLFLNARIHHSQKQPFATEPISIGYLVSKSCAAEGLQKPQKMKKTFTFNWQYFKISICEF